MKIKKGRLREQMRKNHKNRVNNRCNKQIKQNYKEPERNLGHQRNYEKLNMVWKTREIKLYWRQSVVDF